jgi:hypothetical protein
VPDISVFDSRPPGLPGLSKLKADPLIVAGFIASLKVTVTTPVKGTLVPRFAGFVDTTVGHFPIFSIFSSLHPLIKAAEQMAAIAVISIFFVFMYFKFEMSLNK